MLIRLSRARTVALATLWVMGAMPSLSQAGATATATISAVILTPISITKNADLSFGDVYPDVSAVGTITIDPSSNRTAGGAAALGPAVGSAAQFTITGESSVSYAISLPTTPVSLTSSASNTMTADGFVADGSGLLDAGGSEVVGVGATLHVSGGQAAGSYSGTFDVTVNYN